MSDNFGRSRLEKWTLAWLPIVRGDTTFRRVVCDVAAWGASAILVAECRRNNSSPYTRNGPINPVVGLYT